MCFTQIEKNTNSKNQKYILENTCLEIHSEGVLDPNWKDGATSFPLQVPLHFNNGNVFKITTEWGQFYPFGPKWKLPLVCNTA